MTTRFGAVQICASASDANSTQSNTELVLHADSAQSLPPEVRTVVSPAPPREPGLSIVIPAYNEEDRIGDTLEKYLPSLESSTLEYEVLVIADGRDMTAEIARKYRERGVQVLREDRKLGKGGAILHGFRRTRFSVVGYVDADGSLSVFDFKRLIEMTYQSEAGCVIASRWVPGGSWLRRETLPKRLASRGFNLLVRGLLLLRVRDTQCGAKFYQGHVIDQLLPQVTVTNLTTDVGFLFHAHRNGARIMEVPVTWDDDPRSRFNLVSMVPIMFLTVIGIRLMSLPMGKYVPKPVISKLQTLFGSI